MRMRKNVAWYILNESRTLPHHNKFCVTHIALPEDAETRWLKLPLFFNRFEYLIY